MAAPPPHGGGTPSATTLSNQKHHSTTTPNQIHHPTTSPNQKTPSSTTKISAEIVSAELAATRSAADLVLPAPAPPQNSPAKTSAATAAPAKNSAAKKSAGKAPAPPQNSSAKTSAATAAPAKNSTAKKSAGKAPAPPQRKLSLLAKKDADVVVSFPAPPQKHPSSPAATSAEVPAPELAAESAETCAESAETAQAPAGPLPTTTSPNQKHLSQSTRTFAETVAHASAALSPTSSPSTQKNPSTKSFAETVAQGPASSSSLNLSFAEFFKEISPSSLASPPPTFEGKPAAFFTSTEIQNFSQSLNLALVGKFSRGKPTMELLKKDFDSIGFKSQVNLGLMDSRNILIRFKNEEDYQRCWLRGHWNFRGFGMRVFKWTPEFQVHHDPAIAPVWLTFHKLPLHFFNKRALFNIAKSIGQPLKIDQSTASLNRPSVARVCVELNLLHKLPERIWIGVDGSGFWQSVEYEKLPLYCNSCKKMGHQAESCKGTLLSNSLLPKPVNPSTKKPPQPQPPAKQQPVWQPKPTQKISQNVSILAPSPPVSTHNPFNPLLLEIHPKIVSPKSGKHPATHTKKDAQNDDVFSIGQEPPSGNTPSPSLPAASFKFSKSLQQPNLPLHLPLQLNCPLQIVNSILPGEISKSQEPPGSSTCISSHVTDDVEADDVEDDVEAAGSSRHAEMEYPMGITNEAAGDKESDYVAARMETNQSTEEETEWETSDEDEENDEGEEDDEDFMSNSKVVCEMEANTETEIEANYAATDLEDEVAAAEFKVPAETKAKPREGNEANCYTEARKIGADFEEANKFEAANEEHKVESAATIPREAVGIPPFGAPCFEENISLNNMNARIDHGDSETNFLDYDTTHGPGFERCERAGPEKERVGMDSEKSGLDLDDQDGNFSSALVLHGLNFANTINGDDSSSEFFDICSDEEISPSKGICTTNYEALFLSSNDASVCKVRRHASCNSHATNHNSEDPHFLDDTELKKKNFSATRNVRLASRDARSFPNARPNLTL